MDYRKNAFKLKFESASHGLRVQPNQIVSIKVRGVVYHYDDYRALLEMLQRFLRISVEPVGGNFQGDAYLVSDDQDQLIVVKHETGLEILYIAASIASLVGLIPTIIQLWSTIRGKKRDRLNRNDVDVIEIRYFNPQDEFIEERYPHSISYGIVNPMLLEHRIKKIEEQYEYLYLHVHRMLEDTHNELQKIQNDQRSLRRSYSDIMEKLAKKRWFFGKF